MKEGEPAVPYFRRLDWPRCSRVGWSSVAKHRPPGRGQKRRNAMGRTPGMRGTRSRKRFTRRQFLAAAGAGAAGGALLRIAPWEAGIAPAQNKGTSLRILTWSHFVPAY